MVEDMAVYIANLGKYNEGELVGAWFRFPLNEEEIAERIGLNAEYEEYAVHDTDNFPMEVSEYTSIEELNRMYDTINELPAEVLDNLNAFVSHFGSLEALEDGIDRVICYSGCDTMEDVATYCVYELNTLGEIPPAFHNYIDCEAYGRDLEIEGCFIETSYGMCEIMR